MKFPGHLSLLALVMTLPAAAQSSYPAAHIVFKNPGLFSQQQLEAVSGMHPGSPADAAGLQAAAQRLADTGYFGDIGAGVDGPPGNLSATFVLQPIHVDQMLRAGFDNFVWLTHAEMEAAIHAKFPLFIGYVVEGTPQSDSVSAALTQALAAKGVVAKVEYETIDPTLEHPSRTIEFRIASPRIVVSNIHLEGVSPALVPLVQKSVNDTAATGYNDGLNGALTSERILAPLLDAGYIQAALDNVSVSPSPVANGIVPVVVSASLRAGDIYRVSALSFAGSPLLSAAAFAASAKLHPGDVASHKALLETLQPLDAAYRRQGYMDVVVTAAPAPNAVNHRVAYTVGVTPGQQYRVHEVKAENLDPDALAEFNRGFTLKPGDLYNPEYLTDFLKNNTSLRALQNYTASFKAYAYPATHTVDVVLTFFPAVRVTAH